MSTYSDHSQLGEATQSLQQEAVVTMSPESFPVKLYAVLAELEATERSFIASWAPHGRCFKVHDSATLVETVLPTAFRQTQLSSFQRQLNLYGFTRVTAGPDKHSYYHEFFLRSRPHLMCRIRRTPFKGHGPRRAVGPDTHPNFYAVPFLPPLRGAVTHATATTSDVLAPVAGSPTHGVSPTGASTRVAPAAHAVAPAVPNRTHSDSHGRLGHRISAEAIYRPVDSRLLNGSSMAFGPSLSHQVMHQTSVEAPNRHADLRSLYGPSIAHAPPTLASRTARDASQIASWGRFATAGGAAQQANFSSLYGSMASAPAQLGSSALANRRLDGDALALLLSQQSRSEAMGQAELGAFGPNIGTLLRDNVPPLTSMAALATTPLPTTIDPNSLAGDVLSRALVTSLTRNDHTSMLEAIQSQNRQLAVRQRIRQLEQAQEEEETRRLITLALLNGL